MSVPSPLVRDRAMAITFAALGMWGFALYAMGAILLALRDELGVTRTQIGLAGSALAIGSMVGGGFSPMLFRRLGQPAFLAGSVALIGLSGVGFAVATDLPQALGAAFVLGLGGALTTIVAPVVIEARQPHARAEGITEANFWAGAAGVISPLVMGAAIAAGVGWKTGPLLGAAAGVAVAVFARTLPPAAPRPADEVHHEAEAGGSFGWGFWRWWLALVLGVAAEFCISFWAADFMESAVGMSAGLASGLMGVFVGGIALGRFAGGRLVAYRSPVRLIVDAYALLLCGAAVFWLAQGPVVSVIGLALLGLGISVVFPLCMSLAIGGAPRGRAEAASTLISLGASTAILAAPFALGALGDAVGPRRGFLLVPVIVLAALALVVGGGVARRRARRRAA